MQRGKELFVLWLDYMIEGYFNPSCSEKSVVQVLKSALGCGGEGRMVVTKPRRCVWDIITSGVLRV